MFSLLPMTDSNVEVAVMRAAGHLSPPRLAAHPPADQEQEQGGARHAREKAARQAGAETVAALPVTPSLASSGHLRRQRGGPSQLRIHSPPLLLLAEAAAVGAACLLAVLVYRRAKNTRFNAKRCL